MSQGERAMGRWDEHQRRWSELNHGAGCELSLSRAKVRERIPQAFVPPRLAAAGRQGESKILSAAGGQPEQVWASEQPLCRLEPAVGAAAQGGVAGAESEEAAHKNRGNVGSSIKLVRAWPPSGFDVMVAKLRFGAVVAVCASWPAASSPVV